MYKESPMAVSPSIEPSPTLRPQWVISGGALRSLLRHGKVSGCATPSVLGPRSLLVRDVPLI